MSKWGSYKLTLVTVRQLKTLFSQTIPQLDVAALVIFELYRNYGRATCVKDTSGNAAMGACERQAVHFRLSISSRAEAIYPMLPYLCPGCSVTEVATRLWPCVYTIFKTKPPDKNSDLKLIEAKLNFVELRES